MQNFITKRRLSSDDLYEKALETVDPLRLAQVLTDLVCEISLAGGQSVGDWASTVTQMCDNLQAHAESARSDGCWVD
jgi:hypothetical protein